MPPKVQPKTFILPVKTHKLTILVTSSATNTISSLKEEVVSGLTAPSLQPSTDPPMTSMDVDENDSEWEVPKVQTVTDFELARAVKEKGRPTGRYETLDANVTIKSMLINWEYVFIQFRDQQGNLQPVKVSLPSLVEDDDEEEPPAARKGKRKAHPDDPLAQSDT